MLCVPLCPGYVDTARRVTEARALNHSYQMLWYSDIGTRHSAITLSPGSANQSPGYPCSDQSEAGIVIRLLCPGHIHCGSRPCQISIISANFVLNIMSCSSLLAYKTNRKYVSLVQPRMLLELTLQFAQVIWRTHGGAIWKNVEWVGSEHEVIMIMTVFPPLSQYQMVRLQTPANFAH